MSKLMTCFIAQSVRVSVPASVVWNVAGSSTGHYPILFISTLSYSVYKSSSTNYQKCLRLRYEFRLRDVLIFYANIHRRTQTPNFVFQKGSLNILIQTCTKQRLFYQTFPTIIANSCIDTVRLRIK